MPESMIAIAGAETEPELSPAAWLPTSPSMRSTPVGSVWSVVWKTRSTSTHATPGASATRAAAHAVRVAA